MSVTGRIFNIPNDGVSATIQPDDGSPEVQYSGQAIDRTIENGDGVEYDVDSTGKISNIIGITKVSIKGTPTEAEMRLLKLLVTEINKRKGGGGGSTGKMDIKIKTRD